MKKLILLIFTVISSVGLMAQSWNPYVKQGIVSPAPLLPVEFNGTGELFYEVGNTGISDITLVSGDTLTLDVELLNGVPNGAPLAVISGPAVPYFNWTYDAGTNTYTGKQNQTIPGNFLAAMTIQYLVTNNTDINTIQNGFSVQLTPPLYTGITNAVDDDFVSSYTYVRATDYGDAPISYGDAIHNIDISQTGGLYNQFIYLGTQIDPEDASIYSVDGQGDDNNGLDDDDGVTFPVMEPGTTVIIPVDVTIVNIGFAFLYGWIDWNNDGVFDPVNELITAPNTFVFASQTVNISVTIPPTVVPGSNLFGRFRVGDNNAGTPAGFSNYGEVEDYLIQIDGVNPCDEPNVTATTICESIANEGMASIFFDLDCDDDGYTNAEECNDPNNPSDPTDPCDVPLQSGETLCDAINAGGELSAIGMADCDMDGVSNWLECNPPVGTPPTDPEDPCDNPYTTGNEVCDAITNGATGLIGVDCDGGGIDDSVECDTDGTDPLDPCDDVLPAGTTLCDVLASAPAGSPVLDADCDDDGYTNDEECNDPNNPSDPEDPCSVPLQTGETLCDAINAAGELSGIGMADCDMDGVSNWLECNPPVGTPPTDPEDPCDNPYTTGNEVCDAITNGATGLIGVDCDGGGIDDSVECNTDDTDPLDPCDDVLPVGTTLCDVVANAVPGSPVLDADCDDDGYTNAEECNDPNNPSDPEDPCSVPLQTGETLCDAINAAGELSGIGMADCDMDGVSNWLECNPPNGVPPTDPEDPCDNPYTTGNEVCDAITNGATGLIGVDCDGGGIDDSVECDTDGTDPLDPCDDVLPVGTTLCDIVANALPGSPVLDADCDDDGYTNAEECNDPNNPSDPTDPCDVPLQAGETLCDAINAAGEMSGIGMADCDMDGVSNWLECNPPNGVPPTDPEDPCDNPYTTGNEVCDAITNGATGLIGVDCDGGGIDDSVECDTDGTDPLDPCDDVLPVGTTLCEVVAAAPAGSPVLDADCDDDGYTNDEECNDPNNPSDPEDPCSVPLQTGETLCDAINAAGELSGIGMADCDMDGVSNWLECNPPNGVPPTDPEDPCDNPYTTGNEVCDAITNGATGLIGVDCDGGGIDDSVECDTDGTDPLDPCDDVLPVGTTLCEVVAAAPAGSPVLDADCDDDGYTNDEECNDPNNPSDPEDPCSVPLQTGETLCDAINAGGELSAIGMADCDMDGVSNWLECNPPVGTPPTDPEDPCDNPYTTGNEVCDAITNGATGLIGVDCDGGGIDDSVECDTDGTDPLDPCDDVLPVGTTLCEVVAAAPAGSPVLDADCDDDGYTNDEECNDPNNPSDPTDPCDVPLQTGETLCDAINAAGELSGIGMADCDMDGVSNWLECNPPVGTPPTDPEDPCDNPYTTGNEVCDAITNGATGLIGVDCDGGGIDDSVECDTDGTDPLDPCDDVLPVGTTLCDVVAAAPAGSPVLDADCDDDGYTNDEECNDPNNPSDPEDPCDVPLQAGETLCDAINAAGEMSGIGMADCDMDGVSNWLECNPPNGVPPTDPEDPCDNPYTTGNEVCDAITNGATGLIGVDCDGGGINDSVECDTDGTDPLDPCDDVLPVGTTLCDVVAAAPAGSPVLDADCDDDGYTNAEECNDPNNPSDPEDPCDVPLQAGETLCDAINAAGELSAIGMADCDMDGVSNWLECNPPNGVPPTDPEDPCDNPYTTGNEVCDAITNGATGLIGVDCDGGGIDDSVECDTDGTDPLDPCDDVLPVGTTLCDVVAAAPAGSPVLDADCDDDGYTNDEECNDPNNPSDPEDPCDVPLQAGETLCDAINAAGEMSGIGMADCDMDGVSNWLECNPPNGVPPTDPEDPCDNPYTTGNEVCDAITNGATGLIGVDCDGGGIDDSVECDTDGTDPLDPCDDVLPVGTTLCDVVAAAPAGSPVLDADCDDDGYTNDEECNDPNNPSDPEDPCDVPLQAGETLCDAINAAGEMSGIGMADCDMDGVSNWLECNPPNGVPPTDPEDPCDNPYTTGSQVCTAITNGATGLVGVDCDGGGVDDSVECLTDGTDPLDPCDDLGLTAEDICNSISLEGTDSPFYGSDCDNGGVNNEVECMRGDDPTDPSDDVARGELGNFVWNDLDGDGIQDIGEPGIVDVRVDLYDGNGNYIESAFTDNSGNYLFDELFPGDYYLQFFTPDGYDPTFQDQGINDSTDSDADPGTGITIVTTLDAAESDLSWSAGYYICVPIGEFVWYDTDEDDYRDFTENGINGLQVQLYRRVGGSFELYDETLTGLKPGTPSTDGYFKFCAPPGEYYVSINLPPFGLVPARKDAQGFIPLAPGNGEQTRDNDLDRNGRSDNFTVLSGEELCSIGAGYYPMATAGNLVWFDENSDGRQDASEPRVADVVVEVIDAVSGEKIDETLTNNAGVYHIDRLQATSYYMRFTPPVGYSFTQANSGDETKDSDVDYTFGERTTNFFTFTPGVDNPNIDAGLVAGVLPVEWIGVRAERLEDRYNRVFWSTAQEVNTSHFDVERSLNGSDWKVIGRQEAQGTSEEQVDYSVDDLDSEGAGMYLYRIKQVDSDGAFDYSVTVSIEVKGDRSDLAIYPNPTSGIVNIDYYIDESAEVKIDVLDNTGRLVDNIVIEQDQSRGWQAQSIDLSGYAAGVYTVRIYLPTEVVNTNVILIK